MSDDRPDDLNDVVFRFIAAEEALTALRDRRVELQAAAERLLTAGDALENGRRTSVDALEAVRAELRAQLEADLECARQQAELDASVAQAASEMRLVLEQLRELDPGRLKTDLQELRRDGADTAAEVRELRRLTNDMAREIQSLGQLGAGLVSDHRTFESAVQELSAAHAAGLERLAAEHQRIVVSLGELTERMTATRSGLLTLAKLVRVTLGAVCVTTVLAIVGLLV